jgi:hypothetical protein
LEREAIIAAIQAIPTSKSPEEIASFLSTHVHSLMATGGDGRRKTPALSGGAVRARLDDVQKAAAYLGAALQNLPPQAASIYRDLAGLKRTVRTIAIIAGAASSAENVLEFDSATEPEHNDVRPSVVLALDAAYVFAMVSGNRPGRRNIDGKKYGPYLEFVTAIFKARGMKASPENSAKEALAIIAGMEKET